MRLISPLYKPLTHRKREATEAAGNANRPLEKTQVIENRQSIDFIHQPGQSAFPVSLQPQWSPSWKTLPPSPASTKPLPTSTPRPPTETAEAVAKRAGEGYNTTDWYYSTKSL
jgi:hypothetical protein